MLPRLPTQGIGELKAGDAVMVVASQADAGSTTLTAVTMLSGVEPILAFASPTGAPAMTLSPLEHGWWGRRGSSRRAIVIRLTYQFSFSLI